MIGGQLYAPESLKLEANLFIQDIRRRLYDLEVGHFDLDQLDDFKNIMYASAQALDQEIWKTFDSKVQDVEFLSGSVEAFITVPHDEYLFRLDSRIKRTLYREQLRH